MERDITRFRGCLKGIYFDKINKDVIRHLIDIDAVYIDNDNDHFGTLLPNSYQLDNNNYHLNNDIFEDIFKVIEKTNEFVSTNALFDKHEHEIIDEIDTKVYSVLDKDEKLKILKKYRKKILRAVGKRKYEQYHDYCKRKNDIDYDLDIFDRNGDIEWEINLMFSIEANDGIIDYLRGDFTSSEYSAFEEQLKSEGLKREFIFGDFDYLSKKGSENILSPEHIINVEWQKAKASNKVVCYIDEVLDEIITKDKYSVHKKPQSNLENTTQRLILLNKVINNPKSWNELKHFPTKKSQLLEPILQKGERAIRTSLDYLNTKKSNRSATKNEDLLKQDFQRVNDFLKSLDVNLEDPKG